MEYKSQEKTNSVFITIRKNIEIDKDLIQEYLNLNCSSWSFIEHKNDFNENGELEGCHYHIIAFYKCQKRFTTISNQICKYFVNYYEEFNNNHGIKIDSLINYQKALQYFLHENNKNKTPHDFDEIYSNLPREELLKDIQEDIKLNVNVIRDLALKYEEYEKDFFIEEIGFYRYNMYRFVINDIFKSVQDRKRRKINIDNSLNPKDLPF